MITVINNGSHYLVKNDSYGAIYVDGSKVNRGTVAFKNEPQRIYTKSTQSRVTHAFDKETNSNIAVEAYNEMINALPAKVGYDEFETLEDEFEYRKFFERYEVIKEDYEQETDLKFKIINLSPSEYFEIQSFYSIGEPLDQNVAHYQYTPAILEYLKELAKKYNLRYDQETSTCRPEEKGAIVTTTHQKPWEFAKVDGNYMFLSKVPNLDRTYRGPYDEMVKRRQEVYNLIEKAVVAALPQDKVVPNAQQMLAKVKALHSKVGAIRPYEKSRMDKNRAMTQLNDIIEDLEKSLMNAK